MSHPPQPTDPPGEQPGAESGAPPPPEPDGAPVGFGKPRPPQDVPSAGGFGAPQDPSAVGFGAPPGPPPQQDGFGAPPAAYGQPPSGFGAPSEPPPAGGFGAPQDPSVGGFGAPQPPQQGGYGTPHPGYGYPTAPAPAVPGQPGQPGPPPPPAGYGYPTAPGQPESGYGYPGGPGPSGFGQPGQPGQPLQQQPYGAPYGAPTVLAPAPAPAPRRSGLRNPVTLIIGAAVLVIALIVGGGVLYAASGDDDKKNSAGKGDGGEKPAGGGEKGGGDAKGGEPVPAGGEAKEKAPANPKSKPLFQVPSPVVKGDSTLVVAGSWLTDKVYAKSGVGEVVGYDPAGGDERWTVKLTGPVCAASRHVTADNRTALIAQPAMPTKAKPHHGCTQVSVLDLDTGKLLWTKTAKSADRTVSFDEVTIGAGTVAAGGSAGGAAWTAADGAQLWAPKLGEPCYDAGYAGGENLVAVRRCGSFDSRRLEIQKLDPKTGKPLSTYKMATGVDYASVVSTKPLVVAADIGDSAGDGSSISDFFAIDEETGKLRSKFTAEGDKYAARCDATRVEQCKLLAVGNDRLYLPTEEHDGSKEFTDTNEVVAFDLKTGKLLGARADAGDGYVMTPIRMDGGNVLAYQRGPYDKGGRVVSLDGTSLEETLLMENPATESSREPERSFLPEYAEYLFGDGRFYMSALYARKPYSTDEEAYLAVAFGTR
ncbi:PQQ-binding-like beta-propeller repeat protein [Streptomyces sp. NPDC002490]|uniref:outer membrane protein assembly factor BamB family protein n=1 Tax=Streptomyces sp. NPDC002490 TaxID=3154416 RepID=UPI0033219952